MGYWDDDVSSRKVAVVKGDDVRARLDTHPTMTPSNTQTPTIVPLLDVRVIEISGFLPEGRRGSVASILSLNITTVAVLPIEGPLDGENFG